MSFDVTYFVESVQAVFVGVVLGYLIWRGTDSGAENVHK
jgi:hypothetical protein